MSQQLSLWIQCVPCPLQPGVNMLCSLLHMPNPNTENIGWGQDQCTLTLQKTCPHPKRETYWFNWVSPSTEHLLQVYYCPHHSSQHLQNFASPACLLNSTLHLPPSELKNDKTWTRCSSIPEWDFKVRLSQMTQCQFCARTPTQQPTNYLWRT